MIRSLFNNRWIILLLFIALEVYVFQALKEITKNASQPIRWTIYGLFGLLSLLSAIFLFYLSSVSERTSTYLLSFVFVFFVSVLFCSIFLAVDDLRRGITWIVYKLQHKPAPSEGSAISRSTFLSWLGVIIGGSFFGTMAYGISNRYNYKVRKKTLHFPNLPEAFKGLKIVQLSDIHSGSFTNKAAVERGVQMALAEKPDLILFTGDLVNNRAIEMKDYMDVFNQLKAPMGVFSTLGNHDYGDYVNWPSPEAKVANLDRLKAIHGELGWKLMMNEHHIFERNGQKIALIGIENWGAKGHFPKYGRMDLAYPGTENIPFKILMSHDPSHWDAEVRPKYPDIDLTLSGHTHGMQFGIDIPGFKWSPIKWMYKEWEDLYQESKQYIYVNRGYGFLGYPGRVGILPEITVLELV